jgi:hypothetical protein
VWWLLALEAGLLLAAAGSQTPSRPRPRTDDGPPLPPRPAAPSRVPDPPLELAVLLPLMGGLGLMGVVVGMHAARVFDDQAALGVGIGTVLVSLAAGVVIRLIQWEQWHTETDNRLIAHQARVTAWEDACKSIHANWVAECTREAAQDEAQKEEHGHYERVNAAHDEARREDEHETMIVQGALLWWTTERLRADDFVSEHWQELISSERRLLAEYVDPRNPCSSMERCLSLARSAASRMRSEIAYLLGDDHRSVEDIAVILRRRHGFAVECLLPKARSIEREQRLVPRPDAGQLAAARATEELDAKRLATLREAGAWWQSEGRLYGDSAWLERHVQWHRRWILRQMDSARAAYHDESSLTSSFESCQALAAWALEHRRAEVLYHFQDGADGSVSVDPVAHALRRYHGRMVEVLIPLALDARESTDSSAIFAKLEPEALKMFEAVQSVVQTEEVAKQLIQEERLRLLRQEHVREDELEARLEPYRKIVLQAAAKFSRLKGFVR